MAFGTNAGYRILPNLEIGGDLSGLLASYDGPDLSSSSYDAMSNHRSLSCWGLGANVRGLRALGVAVPYAEAGISYYSTVVSMSKYDLTKLVAWFGISTSTRHRTDSEIAPHAAVGIDFAVSKRTSVGLEYRRLWLHGDFGELSGGEVSIAESVYQVVIRSSMLGARRRWPF
jgi:opacity protein-like surface antigen